MANYETIPGSLSRWKHRSQASQPGKGSSLAEVSTSLQRLDPVWDVLSTQERRRVLELLDEKSP